MAQDADNLTISIPGFKEMKEEMGLMRAELCDLKTKVIPEKEWYDLKEAAQAKGVSYNTLKSNRRLQPNYGIPDGIVCGRRRWRRETILMWITQTDDELLGSLKKKT